MRLKQVFQDQTFKRMDALRKTCLVSHRLCFEPLFFDMRNVEQILTMIAGVKSLSEVLFGLLLHQREV